jgi:hypothetical protein
MTMGRVLPARVPFLFILPRLCEEAKPTEQSWAPKKELVSLRS